MRKFKSKIVLVVIFAFVLSTMFTACGGTTSSADPNKNPPSDKLLEFEMFVNYPWYTLRFPFDESNEIAKWIIQNKKVKVNFTWPAGSERDKINLFIATDTVPDTVVIAKDDIFTKLIENDRVIALDDYINKYEGYRNAVSEQMINFSRYNDGKIYHLLNWSKTKDWLGYGMGAIINKELHKKVGSPEIKTLDDLYNYLMKIKGMKVDGSPVVPLQPGATEIQFGMLWAAYGEGRLPIEAYGISYRPDSSGRITHVINDPKFPEFISYLRKLYNAGLVSKEYSIEKQEQIDEKLQQKRIGFYLGTTAMKATERARTMLEMYGDTNPYDTIDMPAAPGVDQKTIVCQNAGTDGWNNIVISKRAKEPERIFQYLDWLLTPEGQRVTGFGPEGFLWEGTTEQGYPKLKQSYNLSEEEKKKLPLGEYMFPGNASYFDSAKEYVKKFLSEDQISWEEKQNTKYANRVKDTTEFAGINVITEKKVLNVYGEHDTFWKKRILELVTSKQDVKKMIADTRDEIYTKWKYKEYEDFANNIWQENKKKLGLN